MDNGNGRQPLQSGQKNRPSSDAIIRAEITGPALQALLDSCRAAWPGEGCGALGARIVRDEAAAGDACDACDAATAKVDAVWPIRNSAAAAVETPCFAADRFAFDPEDWTRVLYGMTKSRQSLVGFYHSHPATAPFLPGPIGKVCCTRGL